MMSPDDYRRAFGAGRRSPPPARSGPPLAASRGFQAGARDRLTASWTITDLTANQALLRHLRPMRARSRDFARNNEYGRQFFRLVRTNIVGPSGFALKFDCRRDDGSIDQADSKLLLRGWKRFAKRGQYEVTGRLSETMFDTLAITMIARDGEVLIRLVEGKDRGVHRCQLQLLPGHLLDEDHNRDLEDGRRIRMGVEFDAWMKPIAYHLRLAPKSADMHGATSQRYERVPAEEMLHLFVPEEVDQWRGIPWAFAGLRDARQLDQFDEAALVAANVGAAKMGFFQQQKDAEGPPVAGEKDGDDFVTEAAPGTFDIVPDGYELKEYNPTYPNELYDPFVKAVLRRQSVAFGVSYHSLSGDLTSVSFSSIRSGTLDEREMWKMLQGLYIEFKEQIVGWWLARAMLFDAELIRLPFTKFDKFNCPVFLGRRWDWVDPRSDILAEKEAVALKIKSRAQIIRERGRDPEEVWAEIEAEEARGMTAPATGAAAARPAEDEEEQAGKA
jgi:lambda family phage portal protein